MMMNERVIELIEAYGADPLAWPEEERLPATVLLEAKPDLFAEALAEARAVDLFLETEAATDIPLPEDLAHHILHAAPRAPDAASSRAWIWRTLMPSRTRWPASAALASLAVGIAGGYSYASPSYESDEEFFTAAFGYTSNAAFAFEEGQFE